MTSSALASAAVLAACVASCAFSRSSSRSACAGAPANHPDPLHAARQRAKWQHDGRHLSIYHLGLLQAHHQPHAELCSSGGSALNEKAQASQRWHVQAHHMKGRTTLQTLCVLTTAWQMNCLEILQVQRAIPTSNSLRASRASRIFFSASVAVAAQQPRMQRQHPTRRHRQLCP